MKLYLKEAYFPDTIIEMLWPKRPSDGWQDRAQPALTDMGACAVYNGQSMARTYVPDKLGRMEAFDRVLQRGRKAAEQTEPDVILGSGSIYRHEMWLYSK